MVIISTNEAAEAQKVKSGSFSLVLKTLLSSKTPSVTVLEMAPKKNILYVDCRERKEYNVSHIYQALYVGYKDFDISRLKDIPKDGRIIVYCSIGKRSENIIRKLMAAGFTNASNLYGGIFEWVNEGNPVYDSKGNQTNRVHAYGKFWGQFLDRGEKIYD